MILIKHKYYFKKKNRDLLWIKHPAYIYLMMYVIAIPVSITFQQQNKLELILLVKKMKLFLLS